MTGPSDNQKTWYITTPIYYVNGRPHIGSALTTVACDFLARYHRLKGEKVWFLTGTDEQATKVLEAAHKAGVAPQEFVDGLAADFKQTWKCFGISYDDFIRTTEPRHIAVVQEVFDRLKKSGDIYKDIYEGWYCVADETYFRDSDVITVGEEKLCPNPECRLPLRRMQEENYFFRLSAYGDRLLAHIEANPKFLEPHFRQNEVVSFIKQGLRDMSVARPGAEWGIRVKDDPKMSVYVWFDALINYLAATGWPNDMERFAELWPANVHAMGKEIYVRFHATLWPAMLMALGLELPKQVYGHGWWVDGEGKKSGKRTGGLPHPVEFAEKLAEVSGASVEIATDALRFLMIREMNFHGDTEYSYESFTKRYNSDLANDLGNLCNRSVTMLSKFFDGVVPVTSEVDRDIASIATTVVADYELALEEFRFHSALEAVWQLVGRMNRYIEERAPWKQAKAGETEALAITLSTCLEAIRIAAVLVQPIMPNASKALFAQIGIDIETSPTDWSRDAKWGLFPAGIAVPAPVPLFPRIQDTATDSSKSQNAPKPKNPNQEKRKLSEQITATEPAVEESTKSDVTTVEASESEVPKFISIDDFLKVELRVGNVIAAETIPKSDKLLKLTVEVAGENRTVLAGIAEMYQPEELVGRQVVVVANLAPRKMRGIESQGMLLAADTEGQAILLQPETRVPSGSRVR